MTANKLKFEIHRIALPWFWRVAA